MARITYLFGAGASANALPCVNKIPERFNEVTGLLINELDTIHANEKLPAQYGFTNKSRKDYLLELVNDFQRFLPEIKEHASVDTYAKKLYLRSDTRLLVKYKLILSIYFAIEQFLNKPDGRYDHFFASILGNSVTDLPADINILSWNYDQQFELSHLAYTDETEIHRSMDFLNVINKRDKRSYAFNGKSNRFKIVKLNGTCGIYSEHDTIFLFIGHNNKDSTLKDLIDIILATYLTGVYNPRTIPLMSFAWERQSQEDPYSIVNLAKSSVQDTKALVVIGYSFPFFNRQIDREIIEGMDRLEKVYIQDKYPDNIVTRFKSLIDTTEKKRADIEIVPWNDCEQFLLPYEL